MQIFPCGTTVRRHRDGNTVNQLACRRLCASKQFQKKGTQGERFDQAKIHAGVSQDIVVEKLESQLSNHRITANFVIAATIGRIHWLQQVSISADPKPRPRHLLEWDVWAASRLTASIVLASVPYCLPVQPTISRRFQLSRHHQSATASLPR